MKKHLFEKFLISAIALFYLSYFSINAADKNIVPIDVSIVAQARGLTAPSPRIIIEWLKVDSVRSYDIYRRVKGFSDWGMTIAKISNPLTVSFTDSTVKKGTLYEYWIRSHTYGVYPSIIDNSNLAQKIDGNTYLTCGIEIPVRDNIGKVLLLIDSTMLAPLSTEINRLIDDLVAEGWAVVVRGAKRCTGFDSAAVINTKAIVNDEYNLDNSLRSIFILGRVAVPYSGILNPDGHGDHRGAWPTDLYYGYLDDYFWTDDYAISSGTSSNDNKNVVGDGKFDQTDLSGDVSLEVGRVDFYGLTDMINGLKTNEIELLRSYLNKDHDYRTGALAVNFRGVVDDNFGFYGFGFAASGWRNFGQLVGINNVTSGKIFTDLSTNNALWYYGCGGGSPNSCGGIGVSADFASKPVKGVFTMLFGSYFGDWNYQNDIMRSLVASNPSVLTSCWAGRPHWYFHDMAMGETIGYSAKLTQNNMSDYLHTIVYPDDKKYPGGVAYIVGNKQVHVALIGDPTLKIYTAPANGGINCIRNLSIVQPGKGLVELKWTKPDSLSYTYNIYRSKDAKGPFTKVNTKVVTDTTFIDNYTYNGKSYYMVKANGLVTSKSGSFYANSKGITGNVLLTGIEENNIQPEFSINCSPNPASDYLNITLSLSNTANTKIEIFSADGKFMQSVYSGYLVAGSNSWLISLNEGYMNYEQGVYFIKLTASERSEVKKFVVIR
ncbi:MAG: T9SS type A sorting domain-containing protein [Candidatus Kapabacteria bacterium]|nr:T9SS type A sorting domain-containing protein [Candidatus Kapabacteria bacterium]